MEQPGFFKRNWQILTPPHGPVKSENPLKFGILGVGNIALTTLIRPASLHPEVTVEAVAARDKTKAEEFAKEHGIPKVFESYLDLIQDPSIDAVYITLSNDLHLEWALRSLAAGKHVLLEKPSVSNATEAELLFRSPLLRAPNAPVLLEAFHYRFEPYWTAFLALLDKPNVTRAKVTMNVPQSFTDKKDLQFRYEVSGGALMDLTYSISLLRDIFGAEPLQCTSCKVKRMLPPSDELCDYGYDATWLFPNGGVGRAAEVLKGTMGWTLRTSLFEEEAWASEAPDDPERGAPMGHASVMHREMVLPDESLPEEQEKVMTREVRMSNYIWGCIWHRIDVDDWYIVRNKADGTVVKRWVERGTKRAYTLREAGIDRDSEPYWMSYKYQLDEFVNRVRGRDGTGVWVSGEDSINQMKMIDMAYEKAGLPVRPTTTFRLDLSGGDD